MRVTKHWHRLPGKLWSLPPWRYSKATWTWSRATGSRWPCLSRGVGQMTSRCPCQPQPFCDSLILYLLLAGKVGTIFASIGDFHSHQKTLIFIMTVSYTRLPTPKLFQFPCLLSVQKKSFESLALPATGNVLSGPYILKHILLIILMCKNLLKNKHCWSFIRLPYFILNYAPLGRHLASR